MTTENLQPMDPEAAYNVTMQHVWAPVFLEKLAVDYGIQPRDAAEQQSLFEMATTLRQQYYADRQQNSPITKAAAALGGLTQEASAYNNAAVDQTIVKQAATEAAKAPQLAAAVLSLLSASTR